MSQAVNVQCPKCAAANLVDPGPARRSFAASALFLGQRAAQAAWEAMRRSETRIKSYRDKRDVPLSLLKELESSARQYWNTALTVEAEHVPEVRRHVASKVESYMKEVEKTLRQFWQWHHQG